jgi:hypothetical protein
MSEENTSAPSNWADLSDDERRVLLEMAKGRLWWEETWTRMGWVRNAGVIIMGVVLFLTWGRDALVSAFGLSGGVK